MSGAEENSSRTHPPQDSLPERRGARRLVSPFRCRIWTQHSRPEEQLTDDACKALRGSIAKHGQHQPALGRPVSDDPDYDVEIICGARRHAVAHALGRELVVEVRPMTDAEAYVAMYEENLLREGDSPYVKGQILTRALRSGTYPSQEALGHAFNLSHSAVSRLLMLAQLPSIIVAAFSSADHIRAAWGVELHRLWSEEGNRDGMAARARSIANSTPSPSPRQIYEALITPSGGRRKDHRLYRNIPVRDASNGILFHEQDQLQRVLYIIPKQRLTPKRRKAVTQALLRILEDDSPTM
jgi:ParB/RepB/Spo0J family partition protein